MAKSVRWQIPFVSIQGVHYRVDIYDEVGGWSGVTKLTPGDTPFVTDENASDDFFCPIRTQTGTLQIVTKLPNGGMITLDELLPANNIARPVFLLNLDNSNAVEWQGFLSCEAYNQDYIGIPQTLSLPLISVLEAMDSVQLDQSRSHGLTTIKSAIKQALDEIVVQVGLQFYTHVNYSGTSYRIFNKYIDQTVLFEQKEYNNENSTTYIVSGLSVKEALSGIATFMGWVVREQGKKIYFERMGDDVYTWEDTYYQFGGSNPSVQQVDFVTKSLASDMAWIGTGHQRSIAAGAKSVEVVAKLEKYRIDVGMPQFPYTDMSSYTVAMKMTDGSSYGQSITVDSIVSSNISFTNRVTFKELAITNDRTSGTPTTIANVINNAIIVPGNNRWENTYVGAFMARIKNDNTDYIDGVYISSMGRDGYNYDPTTDNYVFCIRSIQTYAFSGGKIKIGLSGVSFYGGDTGPCWMDGTFGLPKVAAIKFGNMYWNGQSWQSTFTTIDYHPLVDDDGNYILPITQSMRGELFIYIYPNMWGSIIPADYDQGELLGSLISDIKIEYEIDEDDMLTDRSANHYYRLLGTNFRDEISIGTELASMLNNEPSPSLIMENDTTPMSELTYTISGGDTETRRPEVDLLNRLAAYYGAARQRLELEVAHPTSAPLPLLKLNGINDGKVYLPLSESRDWQTGVCKLTCFESPT